MTKQDMCRIAGGTLVVLVGIAVELAGLQLKDGVPASWPDVIASDSTARNTARVLMTAAAFFVVAGGAAAFNLRWGDLAACLATAVFVVGGFWANFVLFGDIRLAHTGANLIVGVLIVWLLWIGHSIPGS